MIKVTVYKVCSMCGERKSLEYFHKDSRGAKGVRADCKECRSNKHIKPKDTHKPTICSTKRCENCGEDYVPTSNRQQWCTQCGKDIKHERAKQRCREYNDKHRVLKGRSHLTGENANGFKDGIGLYKIWGRNNKPEECERCGSKKFLLVHHRDYDRHNNEPINLELLCKKCHQKEHTKRDSSGRYAKKNS